MKSTPEPREKTLDTSDLSFDMELNRMLLLVIGVWPTFTKQSRILAQLAKFLSVVFLLFFFVPHGYYIFLVEEDSTLRFRMIGPLSFCAMAMAKYIIVIARHDGIKSCIDSMAADWRQVDDAICRSIMLRYSRVCRIFTKLCTFVIFSGAVFFYTWILPFVNGSNDRLESENFTRLRPLPYPSEFLLFDPQTSPMYEIVFVGHSISMALMATVTCGVCALAVKFVMHACSQFEIVVALMSNAVDVEEIGGDRSMGSDNVELRLSNAVRRHLHAVAFVPRIEEVLNEICLVDLVGSTMNICFLGYYLLMEWENSETIGLVTYFLLMMSFVSNIFVICYLGEHLTEQVGIAGYMTNWWKLPSSQARAMILVICISRLPVKFTAGKMVNLSLQTFGSVIKASMAYLNALRTVM